MTAQAHTLCPSLPTLLEAIRRGDTTGEEAALLSGDLKVMQAVAAERRGADHALFGVIVPHLLASLPLEDALTVIDQRLLTSALPSIQRAVGEYLRHAPDEVAHPRLQAMLASVHPSTQRVAAKTLALRGDDLEPLLDLCAQSLAMADDQGIRALVPIAAQLANPRADAVTAQALTHALFAARAAAVEGIDARHQPLPPVLCDLLLSAWASRAPDDVTGEPGLQAHLLRVLGDVPGELAHDILRAQCRAVESPLREAAFCGLARRGDVASLERLLGEQLADDTPSEDAIWLVAALAAIPSWREAALEAFDSQPPALRAALLSHLDPEADQARLLSALQRGTLAEQAAAMIPLGEGSIRAAVPLLLEKLEAAQPSRLKLAAIETLTRLGDGRALQPLRALTEDPDEAVRHAATDTLKRLGWMPDRDAPARRSLKRKR